MVAGLLPELPDSAGQKFPPSGPETGVSAHPDGEQQVSQAGKILEELRNQEMNSIWSHHLLNEHAMLRSPSLLRQ